MPALELAVLTRCEYAKPRKPICEEHRARNVWRRLAIWIGRCAWWRWNTHRFT